MPIPDRVEPEVSRADARLLEFINQRRHQRAQQRRQLIVLGATAVIGLIVLALTAAGLLLFNRSPAPSLSATVAAPPGVRPTPAPSAPPAAPLAAPSLSSPPARAVEPDQSAATVVRPPGSAVAPSGPADEPVAESNAARRTASWLVRTHGRLEAENRALTVAEFYSGERRAFWQRVLTDVRQTPER
jgi:hypothetical protein